MADPEGYSAYDDDEAEPSVEYADHYAGNGAASSRHTKFLDLTNGAGGETGTGAGGGEGGYQEDTMSDTYNDDDDERSPAGNQSNDDAVDALMDAHIRAATNRDVQRSSVRVDPNTPGRVVEPGQEHTGRWTKEEHEAFLSALQMYGKEWKKVAAKVKTRTVVQTRTHAQKYFQKLQKAMEGGNGDRDISKVDMGVASEAKKASTKKKRGNTPSIAAKPRQQEQQQQQQQQQSNMASASQLLSNLTTAAQSIQTPTTNTQSLSASSAFGSAALAGPASFSRPPQQHSLPPRHGFSTNTDAYRPAYATGAYSSFGGGGVDRGWGASTAGAMKINAPDPAESRGKFPEPSPAACGKRKLAEIAAARMLAGVAAIGKPLLPPSSAGNDPDGDVTPPPQSPREFEKPGPPGISLNEAPAPPLMTSSDGGGAKKGLSLQIVNPETFGDPYEERKRRRANGEGSPVTPWDGQLEALVRYGYKGFAVFFLFLKT